MTPFSRPYTTFYYSAVVTNTNYSSAEYKDVYINPDLTPSEAEAAFLLRQKRRDRRRNQAASHPRDTHPTQSSMVHGVTSLSLTAPAFNPAGSQRT